MFWSAAPYHKRRAPGPPWGNPQIQMLLQVPGGIKQYLRPGEMILLCAALLPILAARCPLCRRPHRLRLHGTYTRFAVTDSACHLISVQRHFCPQTGRTLSLLPDFLVPHKQALTSVFAAFFQGFLWLGLELSVAIRAASIHFASRQTARYWCGAVLARCAALRAYAAHLSPAARGASTPALHPPVEGELRRQVDALLSPILRGAEDLPGAFTTHSRQLHAATGVALV
ncbi:MAG: hypothetical protein HW381_193 [Candidatus Rokubacteria bacterium]|nr:hypothetical protein [Candidatus Rokubacteria bacterium]